MKRMGLLFCVFVCGAALFAQTAANEADFDTKAVDGGVTISKYKGKGGDVLIPGTIGGKAVTGIGSYAFLGSKNLTSVTIPAGVTSIGDRTFSDCSGLASVTIPVSVIAIGYGAFSGCSGLASITVAAANRQYKDSDGVLFTKDGKTLLAYPAGRGKTVYIIPAGVTSIGDRTFSGCSGLASVTIPASVTAIGDEAFSGCSGLASITIPAGVTSIGEWAFDGCTGLTQITIPDSVTAIGRGAFVRCTGLTSITLPPGITFISRGLFGRCTNLKSITVPENITDIGPLAFFKCSSLKSITLPENISAAYGVFSGCDSLNDSVRADLRKRFGDGVFDSGDEGP